MSSKSVALISCVSRSLIHQHVPLCPQKPADSIKMSMIHFLTLCPTRPCARPAINSHCSDMQRSDGASFNCIAVFIITQVKLDVSALEGAMDDIPSHRGLGKPIKMMCQPYVSLRKMTKSLQASLKLLQTCMSWPNPLLFHFVFH